MDRAVKSRDPEQFVDQFRDAVYIVGMHTVEDQFGISDFLEYLQWQELSEDEGNRLLIQAFWVCPPLNLFAFLTIVTRTEALCARIRTIAEGRKALERDPNAQVWWERIVHGLVCIQAERQNA